MNDVMLIFVSLYFQFCLRAEALMVAHFSLVIEGIKETEWLQQDCNLLFSGSLSFNRIFCMRSNQFWFDLKLSR